MDIIRAVILGIIQGATEFLPISSSGHLVLFQQISEGFTIDDLFLDIVLHLGTLAAILVFCRREVLMLFRSLTHFYREPVNDNERLERRLLYGIIIATIPTGIIGFFFKANVVSYFSNYFFLAGTFFITTIVLFASRFLSDGKKRVPFLSAFIIGIAQGFAVLPGISRSGVTIVVGQALGLQRSASARFAFVLAIPAILGAAFFSFMDTSNLPNFNTALIFSLVCGMIAAAIVGYISLVVLTKIIEKARLSYFAFYTGAVSVFCFVLALAG